MNKTKKVIMAALLMCIVMLSVGSVMAKQQGDGKGDCDQLRDGSCDDTSCEPLGDQVPDRSRDGSCIVPVADMLKEQQKLQLKEGTCKS